MNKETYDVWLFEEQNLTIKPIVFSKKEDAIDMAYTVLERHFDNREKCLSAKVAMYESFIKSGGSSFWVDAVFGCSIVQYVP